MRAPAPATGRQAGTEPDAQSAELARLRRLLATSPGVLYICEPHGNFAATFVSDNVRQELGYRPEDFIKNPAFWSSRVHPDDASHVFSGVVAVLVHGSHTSEYRFLHGDGTYRWVHDELRLIRDEEGNAIEVTGCWLDITDRKLAEEALQASEERYCVVARTTNDVLWAWEVERNVVEYSDSLATKFGYETYDPTFEWWAAHIHPEDRERVVAGFERALNSDASEWTDRYRLLRSDGTYADVLDRGAILRHADGRVRRMAGAICDVTEQNRLQRQVMHADRLAAVGTLAAGVGHEINNPLAYVVSNVKYVIEELDRARRGSIAPEQLEEIRQALLEADQGAERVRRIVKDLKLFANHENKASDVVAIEQPIQSAINMASHEIKRKAVLVTNFAKDVYVRADEARLGQVFLNLLVNAAQAIPEGSPEGHRISILTRVDDNGYAVVEVADTGHGIAPEHVGQIFDPFFTTKDVGEGTGLGLSISHQIVTQLGGKISVVSSPGRGARFCVRLPAERPSKAAPLPRVMIVDDEEWVTNGMRRLLARSFLVDGFTSPIAALEALRHGARYDLVLCDLMMPEMTGMQLFEIVRRDLPAVAEHFVFMTAGVYTASAVSFLEQVANPCLEKPINIEALRAVARQLKLSVSGRPPASAGALLQAHGGLRMRRRMSPAPVAALTGREGGSSM